MPTYRVKKASHINGRSYGPGELVDYEGPAGDSLELLDEAATKKALKAREVAMIAQGPAPTNAELAARVERLEQTVAALSKRADGATKAKLPAVT